MRILCDRCRTKSVDFDYRDKWQHIEISEKGYGKLGNYYLCPDCTDKFYEFMKDGGVDESC